MELIIFSGLLAAFGVGAVWATRPAPMARVRLVRRNRRTQADSTARP